MDRRRFIVTAGAGFAAVAGGTAVARETRADVALEGALVRASGAPVETARTLDPPEVDYRPESATVRWADTTEPFEQWAHRRAASVASDAVLPAIQARFDQEVRGIGTGVRGLVFGLLVTVDHYRPVPLNSDEEPPEPTVSYQALLDRTPRTVTATVVLEGRSHTRDVAVAVGDESAPEPDR